MTPYDSQLKKAALMSQLERIVYIDRLLRERGKLKTAEVARRFEVGPRQVLRDLEYLRDRLDAPVEYDPSAKVYHYTEAFDTLRFADEKLLLFYVLARSLASNEHYVPVVTRELLAELESHVARDYRPLSERIHYELTISEDLSMENFTIACQPWSWAASSPSAPGPSPFPLPSCTRAGKRKSSRCLALARGNHYTNDCDTMRRANEL
jgi:hypothetical protein